MFAVLWPQSKHLLQTGLVAHGLLWSLDALAQTPPEIPTPDGGLGRVFGVIASIAFVFGFGRQVRNWYKRRARDKRLQAERMRRP